jgi:hypothetical protein
MTLMAIFFARLNHCAVGFLGNIFMFIVYSTKRLRSNSFSIYFRSMSIVNLYITAYWIKRFLIYQYNYNILNQSQYLCKFIAYFIYIAFPISSWLMVVVSVDSFLKITFPTRFRAKLNSLKYQLFIVFVTFAYNIAYYAFYPINTNLEVTFKNETMFNLTITTSSNICSCPGNILFVLSTLQLINSSLLPFVLMIVVSIVTIVFIKRSRNKMGNTTRSDESKRRQLRDIKFGVTIVSLNVVFLIFNAPICVYDNFYNFLNVTPDMDKLLTIIFLALNHAYYAFIFYFQLAVNNLVRRELLELFKTIFLKSTLKESSVYITTVKIINRIILKIKI